MTVTDPRQKASAFIAEIDAVELGVQLFEAVVGVTRPDGLTAKQAFELLPAADKPRILRAAEVAMRFMTGAINNGVKPS